MLFTLNAFLCAFAPLQETVLIFCNEPCASGVYVSKAKSVNKRAFVCVPHSCPDLAFETPNSFPITVA